MTERFEWAVSLKTYWGYIMGMKYALKRSYYTRKGCNRLNLRREWKKIKLGTPKPISATAHSP